MYRLYAEIQRIKYLKNKDFLFNRELPRLKMCLYLTKMVAIVVAMETGVWHKKVNIYFIQQGLFNIMGELITAMTHNDSI